MQGRARKRSTHENTSYRIKRHNRCCRALLMSNLIDGRKKIFDRWNADFGRVEWSRGWNRARYCSCILRLKNQAFAKTTLCADSQLNPTISTNLKVSITLPHLPRTAGPSRYNLRNGRQSRYQARRLEIGRSWSSSIPPKWSTRRQARYNR